MRNALIVRAADALVAIGGGVGTLSEIALALKAGRPVSGSATWEPGRGEAGRAGVAAGARGGGGREALALGSQLTRHASRLARAAIRDSAPA